MTFEIQANGRRYIVSTQVNEADTAKVQFVPADIEPQPASIDSSDD